MSKIKKIEVKSYVGLQEFGLDAGKVNIFRGPKGSGKSSVIEALETAFTNSKRRTEVIRHGEDEATLYVELDNGLEINRKIRNGKADYLKIRKGDEGVPSTERFLRRLINGDIFRPIDWVNLSPKEQTKSILNMLQIEWSQEDIQEWFGEIPSNIEYNQHILMVLKAIETKYFKDREEVNRIIKELKTQIQVIKKELPADYDGEEWRNKKVQEYYNKVSEAQKINQYIEQAKALQEGFETKVQAIKANAENDKSRIEMKYKDQRQDIKDIIDLSNSKIEKAQQFIRDTEAKVKLANEKLDTEMHTEIQKLKDKYSKLKLQKEQEIISESDEQKDLIHIQENKISAKQQELMGLDELEDHEKSSIDEKGLNEIEKEKIRVGKAGEYLEEHEPVDIEPLQQRADKVAEMQSYLRQWDMLIDIRDNKLSDKERYVSILTTRIEKARTLPQDLLKTAKMPIDGISVDEKGLIRIKGTLIDGLSDGEKLELAFKIAKAQAGDLKVICLDRFESLRSDQKAILKSAMNDEYQYFITEHTDGSEMEIEKLGGVVNG
ncbi:MAG: AAA family ATPase [Clostridium tyrobutyricum]|jgi:DNA repair exonuclease SbcCD ATPase subunit|uniref:AAA family ATPase n=1 Tax=Clostridium tyrobutyricum TaxID=1519 RepID=UPI0024302B69|nr:AAA family ATPase [Clostridium tyrobutyricum]MCH4199246.1 AAA family ATPase [Clostridium tyrobutyricum]MCH4236578.1 AAA family ATPase [Clostridium tyrobutyricum]MCH4258106.1 AAA family ATPase [Clostridium tyrobutyricum]MCI1239145.1 AAA family ATPase [Clostridium tyrobutyricum]MCI1651383.1 AAA family ATPase [Clostridium tyrobutyricum]